MRAPDLTGAGGRAWSVNSEPKGAPPDWSATVASWLVNVPGAHPFWSHWMVSVVSLRDIPGVRAAYKRFPEAEYEFMIAALDPGQPLPDPDDPVQGSLHILTPIDVCEQFGGVTDEQAKKLCDGAVRTILEGRLSPDQDYRSAWRALIKNTVEHMALGGHAKAST